MGTPKISVIMSVFAEPVNWLNDAISSILSQTYTDFEFIIVNDNPGHIENGTLLSSLSQKDARIKIIANKKNIGLTKSLNIALDHSAGEYIARMDADDIALPSRLQQQLEFMESNRDHVACGSNVSLIDENSAEFKVLKKPESDIEVKASLFFESPIVHPTLFFRKSIGVRYNENFKYSQDYDILSRIAKKGKMHNLRDLLLKYRVSSKQITASKATEQNNYANSIRKNNIREYLQTKYNIDEVAQDTESIKSKVLSLLIANKNDRINLSAIYYSIVFYSVERKLKSAYFILRSQPYLSLPSKYRLRFFLALFMKFKDQQV